jgi:predicted ATPase
MTTLAKLQEHYRMLQVEDRLLFDEGDWDALAQVRMALDATLEDIEKLTKENV